MPRNYLKQETLLFKRFRTFSPLHIFSFKNYFDRVARWKNTCFFHRAAISTANTTRTRIRRLMEGSAPARRCSFPRWCTVPVACCSKTPETGLHGRHGLCRASAEGTWLRTNQPDCFPDGSAKIGMNQRKPRRSITMKTSQLGSFFRNRRWIFANFSFGCCFISPRDVQRWKIWKVSETIGGNWKFQFDLSTQLLLINITINRVISKMLIFQV